MNTDIQRILNLPVATFPDNLAAVMTKHLRAPGGEWTLREDQARLLYSMTKYRGAVGGLSVGGGKTAVAQLASWALGFEPEEVLVVAPASLVAEASRESEKYRDHFRMPTMPRYISYAKLSDPDAVRILEEIGPKALVCDEAHYLRNKKAARTIRFERYLRANPEVVFVPMSGSFTSGRLMDYAHLWRWALGMRAPIPRVYSVLESWSRVLDVDNQEAPGAYDYALLRDLCAWAGTDNPRQAFYQRLRTAPGVVLSTGSSSDQPIYETKLRIPKTPEVLVEALDELEETWELPDGTEISDQLRLATARKQLALGFYLRWVWPVAGQKDERWLKLRSDYHRELAAVTRRRRTGYETQGLIERILRDEEAEPDSYLGGALYAAWGRWQAVKDDASPETEAVWVDESIIERLVADFGDSGIIWYSNICVGQKLASLGIPTAFAGEEVPADEPLVALSVDSHGTGLNLQRFSRNLVLSPMASGPAWEQLLGRTHRSGQTCPVEFHVYLGHEALRNSYSKAKARAKYIEDTMGAAQKLNLAEER